MPKNNTYDTKMFILWKKVDLSDTVHDFVLDRSFVYSLHFLNRSLKCKWMLKS